MNVKIKHIILFALLMLNTLVVFSQVANDDCFNATPLGTLGAPPACVAGNDSMVGAISTFNNLTIVNSIAEQPYSALINCQPDGVTPMSLTATDVWYTFVNSGNAVTININGNIQNPNISLYDGTALGCGGLIGRGCAIGSGGALSITFDQMVIGDTYYLQVSGGDAADVGTFNMTLQNSNSCSECLLSSNLTVTPPPTNGGYNGGSTVTFCYTVTEWEQQNTNWLHAVIPTFGNGWDLSTLTSITPAATCDGGPGVWDWFTNVVTPNGNGNLTGFFFDGDFVQEPIPDGDPTNNFGDNCNGSGLSWTFCWTITTKDCSPAGAGQNGDNLGVNIDTWGDGETGNWTNIACSSDPIYQFNAQLVCCTPPIMAHTDVACAGDNDGTGTATGQGAGPFNYVWEDAGGTVIQTSNNIAGANTVNGLAAGTYTVTVTDNDNGCITTGSVTITEPTQLQLLIGTTPANCGQSDGTGTVTPQGGTGPYDFAWTDAGGTNIQTDNNLAGASNATGLSQGAYDIDVTDANGCTATVTINVQGGLGNLQSQVVEVPVSCPGFCDGSATVNLNGGTAPYAIIWDANTGNQVGSTANNLCPGTYVVNFSDAGGCVGSTTVNIGEPNGPDAVITFSPWNANVFDPSIDFQDLSLGAPTQWFWQFDALGTSTLQNPTFVFPPLPACYEVILQITDANNCPDSDTVQVCIQPTYSIYFPNAFTPNNDGVNTTFGGMGEGIKQYNMWIFNRWGEMIFHTDDMARQWDGRRKGEGEICLQDVYIYKAEVVDIFNQEHIYLGKVTLVK